MRNRKTNNKSSSRQEKIKPSNPMQDCFIRLEEADRMRQEGKLKRAHKLCVELIKEQPTYMAALHTLGLVYAGLGEHQQALNCLVRAAMFNPRSLTTLVALSGIYLDMDAPEAAAHALEQARAIDPHDTNVLVTLGEIYLTQMEYELARDTFAEAMKAEPDLYAAVTGYGWACSYLGENEEAVETFEKIIKSGAKTFEAYTVLASLPSSLLSIDVLSELEQYIAAPRQEKHIDETMITFVKAAALDRAGRYEEAWNTAVPINRKLFEGIPDDVRMIRERQANTLGLLQKNNLDAASSKIDNDYPISLFVLGPSRSGKTTLEELISTLDGVKRGYESPGVDTAIRQTFQSSGLLTNRFFEALPPQLYPLCRKIYLEELGQRAGSAKVFTNTHPNRINDLGPISLVFPNVRAIFVKRNRDDLAIRIFMRHYRTGNAYAYDMKTIYEHIDWYNEMMSLMEEKLPDQVRIVRYEDMVTDPAGALKIAADLCGLEMPKNPVLQVGDDRGCAEPYREFMAAALN